ncbi:MAG: DNA polymerase III subunit beta [Kiritimatiellales bacterium]|nr:DNA polymerase III subunit beta [Kiritimatiellales bacterium]
MKLSIEKDLILEALQKVQSIVGQRTTLPILSNVLLEADKGKLMLTTTDMEVSVRTSIEADVSKTGSTTLPARRFFSICRDLPSHQVDIEVNAEDLARIKSGSFNAKLEGLSKDDFPPLPSFEEKFSFTLNQGVLKDIMQKTGFAASTDESRAILNGVLMSFKDDKLIVVSTDGRRLALVEQELEIPDGFEADLVVPTKTITELVKTLGDDGIVTIKTSATQVAFEFSDILIVSKLIDGTYPNYKQVIPAQCEERVAIDREMFLSAVRRVSLLLDDQASSVKLQFTENRLELIATAPEIGEADETVPIKYSGKDITIAFNPAFLMAPLKHLDSDEVFIELSDELSPGVIKTNVPFLYVIMPIRVT